MSPRKGMFGLWVDCCSCRKLKLALGVFTCSRRLAFFAGKKTKKLPLYSCNAICMEKYNYELRIMNYELICIPPEYCLEQPVLIFPLGFNRKIHVLLL